MDYNSPVRPELDWDAYFVAFMQKHGKAVPYGNRWLFKDGWSYSMLDTAGPEYPPPSNEYQRRELRRIWRDTYLEMLEYQLTELTRMIFDLEELQGIRDIPLQVGMLVINDEDEYTEVNASLNLDGLKARAEQIRQEIKEVREITIDDVEEKDHGNNGRPNSQHGPANHSGVH